jgi:hypothetical protein
MTAKINGKSATATAKNADTIELKVDGQTLTVSTEGATAIITAMLAARKEAYGLKRTARKVVTDGKKAERVKAQAEKATARAAKAAERVEKLKTELAKLEAKAA